MSVDEANALGFDADSFVAAVERDMGGQMSWTVDEPALISYPTGLPPTTEVSVRASIQRLVHMRVDPALCADGTCEQDGISVPEAECPGHLQADVSVVLGTADGSLEAIMEGYVLQELPGSLLDSPLGSVHAALRDVNGSLKVEPAQAIKEGSSTLDLVGAVLGLNLFFAADLPGTGRLKGELMVSLVYMQAIDDGAQAATAARTFQPMYARWSYDDAPRAKSW